MRARSARARVKLSRNRGHQNALLAGLFTAEGDAIVSIDADLQDDVNAIELMVDRLQRRLHVVSACAKPSPKDSFFKRFTAEAFYRLVRCWARSSSTTRTTA